MEAGWQYAPLTFRVSAVSILQDRHALIIVRQPPKASRSYLSTPPTPLLCISKESPPIPNSLEAHTSYTFPLPPIIPQGGQDRRVWLIARQLTMNAGWWDAPLAFWDLAVSNLHNYRTQKAIVIIFFICRNLLNYLRSFCSHYIIII